MGFLTGSLTMLSFLLEGVSALIVIVFLRSSPLPGLILPGMMDFLESEIVLSYLLGPRPVLPIFFLFSYMRVLSWTIF